MTQLTSSADHLLADLVEELSQKLADGNSADVEAFLADHGEHAEKLRPLIPTLQMLVEIGSSPVATGRSRAILSEENGHETNGHPVLGDFRILREVGRGGMGVVYEAEQISLRRRVALKVLPSAAMLDPRALQRFRNEAQAAAALHHSQIVPIFGVGCERGVHYYAMQFIDGLTLAEVITALRESAGLGPLHQPEAQAREASATAEVGKRKAEAPSSPTPSPQPPAPAPSATETDILAALSTEKSRTSPAWFRRIAEQFAQVADALHHAHELGVTHRDIKPANLMLDRLGHIWITDFGLARIEGEGNLTMTGDLIGTLRYMSPEQSLAKRIGIDHRTDIYSLGITLYELLTLHPALPGHGRQELLRQIAFEEPKSPRKHNRDIPRDLETIVLKMIEKNPAERYQTAADLAADLKRFVDDRHIVARRPSFYSLTLKWSRRHVEWVVSVSLVAVILLAATTLVTFSRAAHERERAQERLLLNQRIDDELRQANSLAARATGESNGEQSLWDQVRERAQQAAALAKHRDADPQLVQQVAKIVDDLEGRNRDAQMLALLDEAMLAIADVSDDDSNFSSVSAWPKLEQALAVHGIVIGKESPRQGADRMKARPHKVREALLAAMEVWARMLGGASAEQRAWLNELAQHLNQDPWREQLHLAIVLPDAEARHTALLKLAADPALERQPAAAWINLEWKLMENGWKDDAIAVLRRAQFRYPDHVWVNHHLGVFTLGTEEAVRCQAMAVALRPQSAALRNHLGWAKAHLGNSTGKYDEALADYREAIRMNPSLSGAYVNISLVYDRQGRLEEAIDQCRQAIRITPNFLRARVELHKFLLKDNRGDEVIAECRKDVQLAPQDGAAHYRLGWFLNQLNKMGEAEVELRAAARLAPWVAVHHTDLGACLNRQGKLDEAITVWREAALLAPRDENLHELLALALQNQGKLDEALAALDRAIQLMPNQADFHSNRGNILMQQGRRDESAQAYREHIRLQPNHTQAHSDLGNVLWAQKKWDEAIDAHCKAIRIHPNLATSRLYLNTAQCDQHKLREAVARFREAILNPDFAVAHCSIGLLLINSVGDFTGGLEEIRRGHNLSSRDSNRPSFSARMLFDAEILVSLDAQFSELLQEKDPPLSLDDRLKWARFALVQKHRPDIALLWYEQAFAESPMLVDNVRFGHRHEAARAALLTATVNSKGGRTLDNAKRSRLIHQAIVWLRDDLAAWDKLAASAKYTELPEVELALMFWQNPDLITLRDDKQVQSLPAEDQELCRKLWADHAELVKSLKAKMTAEKR